jgi:hypothetical protein
VITICLGDIVTRAFWEGGSAIDKGDEMQRAGDLRGAVTWWRRAARWYVPGAPHVNSAYDRLEQLGHKAEAAGDVNLALLAWRGVRSSILATRSFYTPHSERLEPANRKISALMASFEGASADPGKSEEQRTQWHYALLERDESPSVAWSILAILGFLIWVAGGFVFALFAVTAEDELVKKTAALSGAMVGAGLLLWMVGLFNA